jgi:energy-coupling factor transporter ATP-binding protein EcfA2
MSSLRTEQRQELLEDLKQMGSMGRAEGEDPALLAKTFHPVKEHLRMLDTDVVLIVGPRGSGKTEIFRALTDAGLDKAVSSEASSVPRMPAAEKTEWLKAYPLGREGFNDKGLRRFIDDHQGIDPMQGLWFAYLVRLLGKHITDGLSDLSSLLEAPGGATEEVYNAWEAAQDAPLLALDNLDKKLEDEDRFVFVGYDELDILGGSDWDAMAQAVRGLVAFWAAYARRWRRLRPKIFLRSDLFSRFATSGGADLAKLAAGRVELSWSDRQLYEMLLRRIANRSDRLADYIRIRGSVSWREDDTLGLIPTLNYWTDARPIIERMVGPYMGANRQKGLSFRWPLAHVRDGHDRAVPRPLVRLFEEAANLETSSPNPIRGMRILHPMSLRKAIDRVSKEHIEHAQDEWKWIDDLKQSLNGILVPEERRLVENALGSGKKWTVQRPYVNPGEFLDYLVEVGILRQRPDARIDAPDLWLYGLGLKRKGGVRSRTR